MSDEGRLVAGRYRLVHRIGTGAMGVVWQARDERLNRVVAVKQVLLQTGLSQDEINEALERVQREGRIAAKLHHPNAVTVFDVVDEDDAPWLVMEYVPSQSLAAAMKERGALPPLEVAAIGAQIAAALAAAHAAGIVHRDIKPGNILLADNGSVKITDFGISRASDDVTVTKTGLIAGTPAYLAPEVAYGKDPTPPTDVFSLGSTLYAAVEGEPPFGLSENTLGLLHAVAAGRINPPQLAGPLEPVLIALLATEAEDRPTAAYARDMLAAVARGDHPDVPETRTVFAGPSNTDPRTRAISPPSARSRTGVRPAAAPPPPRKQSKRPYVLAAVMAALVLALGGWLIAASGDEKRNDPQPSNINSSQTTTTSAPTFTYTETNTETSSSSSQRPTTRSTPRSTSSSPTSSSSSSSPSSSRPPSSTSSTPRSTPSTTEPPTP
ncbi:serine/threonine protein kinase [Kibdelosporangium philippinense]|uniref:non-specific serine/threonine protein kinase n=1 Tax=Kibdelosporangium philippinense TaxID=211113 RepID=A0ABS8ZDR8_9PSEU|nr:serine/threonine-protein kinase [Kibdelosporangium philippinense]MCE7005986.1 serine/threonine protein kinase [Kibdelosporangium philippinense]